MKISNSQNNFYLTEVSETFTDAEKLNSIFKEYLHYSFNLRQSLDWCERSEKTLNDIYIVKNSIPVINHGVFFLCNPSGDEVGAVCLSYTSGGSNSCFCVHRICIKQQYRGQGYFSIFFNLLAWFSNQFLKADIAQFYTINSAPQVSTKVAQRASVQRETVSVENVPTYSEYVDNTFDRESFEASFTEEEWTPFSLSVNGVVVPTPTKSIPTRL